MYACTPRKAERATTKPAIPPLAEITLTDVNDAKELLSFEPVVPSYVLGLTGVGPTRVSVGADDKGRPFILTLEYFFATPRGNIQLLITEVSGEVGVSTVAAEVVRVKGVDVLLLPDAVPVIDGEQLSAWWEDNGVAFAAVFHVTFHDTAGAPVSLQDLRSQALATIAAMIK
jgi:hypothetical protein